MLLPQKPDRNVTRKRVSRFGKAYLSKMNNTELKNNNKQKNYKQIA